MFFTGSCCDCCCVWPESTVAAATIPASRVLVMFFIVFSLPNWLLLASCLNFGVAGTLLGWYPSPRTRATGGAPVAAHGSLIAAAAFRAPPTVYERAPAPASFPPSTIRYSSRIGRPSNQHSRISRVPAAYRAWAESVVPDTCGVMAWWGIVRHGWS